MKILVLFLVTIAIVFAEHNDLSTIIQMVIADTDVDNNGFISDTEFQEEFINKWDTDPIDGVITKHEFVNSWTTTYNDKHHDADLFFNNLDVNGDGKLEDDPDLIANRAIMDSNPADGIVTVTEFEDFIRLKHPCGGHGHTGC